MAHIATVPEEPFISFERGIDREDPRTSIAKGGYDDGSNIVLRCLPQGGTHVCAVLTDTALDAAATKPPGFPIFIAPFTYSTYSASTLSFSTHIVQANDSGAVWRYDSGSPGTYTLVRRGFTTTQKYWTDSTYDTWLLTFNGREAPMKYGQHFFGQAEARPFMFPSGSKPISPLGATITDENWTHGAGGSFVADASVPGGGSRVHTQSLLVPATVNTYNSWTAAKNFLTGPYPYGGTDFASTDYLVFQIFKAAGTANIRIRFGDDANANYFEFTQSIGPNAGWQTFRLLRSTAVTTGAPVWSSIKRVTFFNDDATNNVYFDDAYFLYANAPPALQVGTYYNTRIVGGGAPIAGSTTSALANLYWSRASFPDEFPPANYLPISGGPHGLARANQITAVKQFGANVVVGTPSSVYSFALDSSGLPTNDLITNEHGIDSHKAMIETPNGALMFFWQKGIYVMRATWRSYGASKIVHILSDLWLDEPWWTQGAFDEKTQTLRFWWREKPSGAGNPTQTTTGIIFDYVRAQELGEGIWTGKMTQLADYATAALVNGQREVLYVAFNNTNITRMGVTSSGALTSYVQLPWMSREGSDRLTKWLGLIVPYAGDSPLDVYIRYASHPDQFDTATFSLIQTLPAAPGYAEQARVLFGTPSRWAQVKFQCSTADGMEIFPPVEMIAVPTKRVP